MKAVMYTKYGPPEMLEYCDIPKPVPKPKEVLVKIRATSLNAADWRLLRADPFMARMYSGLFKPKYQILGSDIAGIVESVGKEVTQFKPGDEVFGGLMSCGLGGFAEYVCATEKVLELKPPTVSFEDASTIPISAITALQGLRDNGKIQAGQKVLINGASGGVGTFAVQLAVWFGAEVTAVCSTKNIEMVRSLGADYVIDYTTDDFTKNGQKYDLILAVNGYHSLPDYRRAMTSRGIYVMAGGTKDQLFQALLRGPWVSMFGKKKMGALTAKVNKADLKIMKELIASGKVKPRIDKCFPLKDTADAFRYMEQSHARGKVIITM